MAFNPNNLTSYALFKRFWNTPEGTDDGLAHRGLDEVTPQGAQNLADFARATELDGSPSPRNKRVINEDERELLRSILEHEYYGSFFELDARPVVLDLFGLEAEAVHAAPSAVRPTPSPATNIAPQSKYSFDELRRVDPERLPSMMAEEYKSRRAHFEGSSLSVLERGRRTLGLLGSYAEALWARDETNRTEMIGHALLDELEKMKYTAVAFKDYNGSGWNAAQSLVLGLDPNHFDTKFPDARPTADTTYLSMNDKMAPAMGFVDDYRAARGMERKAQAYELGSPLAWMLDQEPGHAKKGNLDEKKPFSTSGLNWGVLLFPGDEEIANLPPAKNFEFPIDCINGLNNAVVSHPDRGDYLEVVDSSGKPVKVQKVIERDESGKAVSWSAVFKAGNNKEIEPSSVMGLIKTKDGRLRGDGQVGRSLEMWWWGFCDRNTAQRLYKSSYAIPQLDREQIKIKAGDSIITVPRAEAQTLIDCDVPDLVTGETYCGFRFDDEPQEIKLKDGEKLVGRIDDYLLEAAPGVVRVGGDIISLHSSAKRPFLGSVEVMTPFGKQKINARDVSTVTDQGDGKVKVATKSNHEVAGQLMTELPWNKAKTVDGKKVLTQTDKLLIRGDFTVSLVDGSSRRIPASEVSQITGETQKDVRISQYMVWVSKMRGMYASDGSIGPVVSNGMRWVNKLDIREETGDARPPWCPNGELNGILGPIERQPGDKILWVKGLYAQGKDDDPKSTNFGGWIQVSKTGRIVNEGFTGGQPDFGWCATGPLNWKAASSFNPYYPPEMRLALLVNGVSDTKVLEKMAARLNLPADWKDLLVEQS